MKIQRTLWTAAVTLALAGSAWAAAPATQPTSQPSATPVNAKCPLTGEEIDKSVTTTYDGKTYAFCCASCVESFKKDPAKYAAKAK